MLLHGAALYGLALALAPTMTAAVSRQVVAAFDVAITAPPPPPTPPPPRDAPAEPETGAAGAPAPTATPRPEARPSPPRALREDRAAPRAAATGTADQSGAAAAGQGTGAQGSGEGTGSGTAGNGPGSGRGDAAVTRPVHVSGSIDNARDFPVPPGGRGARRGNEVIVRVIVGSDGRARDCTVYRPSPDPEADAITCRLIEARLGFRPATNSSGEPVPAPFYWRQRWF